jgi:lipopolysaccharide/colanic/teichoic acid biosynthesis glycosyltransferase
VDERLIRAVRLKYWSDRCFGLVFSIVLLPIGLLIAALITLEAFFTGEPPCVFVSERRRSANRGFQILKFRVFRVSAWRQFQIDSPTVSLKDLEGRPEHLTRIGRVLKRCYLDELPQLLNVLRGEMSLVGPRPYFEHDWQRESRLDIPARRILRAGLVGPYQAVKGTISGLDRVNALDADYLDHLRRDSRVQIFVRDAGLIARSVRTLLRAKGL